MLKTAMYDHMLQEGLFGKIGSMFSKAANAAGSFIDKFKSAKAPFKKTYWAMIDLLEFNQADNIGMPINDNQLDVSGKELLSIAYAYCAAAAAASFENENNMKKWFSAPVARDQDKFAKAMLNETPWEWDGYFGDIIGIRRAQQKVKSMRDKKSGKEQKKLDEIARNLESIQEKILDPIENAWRQLMREAKKSKKGNAKEWQRLRNGSTAKWDKVYSKGLQLSKQLKNSIE
jgi:hypothetical protein